MTTEQKIEAIKNAIEMAKNHQSKMDDVAWSVPALSSLKIRHLMNNLGAISTKYQESGVHKGGLFCSTIRNNQNLQWAVATDNWASDETSDDKAYPQFVNNVKNCISPETNFVALKSDTFDIIPDEIGFDLYLYDAAHDYESQRKAMTHFLPAMADTYIACIDDYDWEDVAKGTEDGIKEAGVSVLFKEVWVGNNHDNDGAWNGFAIYLLKK